jgi:hypothetical protein
MKYYLIINDGQTLKEAFDEWDIGSVVCENHRGRYDEAVAELVHGETLFGEVINLKGYEPCYDCHEQYAESLYEDSVMEMRGRLEQMVSRYN